MNHLPVLVVLTPLATALIASVFSIHQARFVRLVVLIGAVAHVVVLLLTSYTALTTSGLAYAVGGWAAPVGIVLVVDAFSAFFLVILAIGHGVVTVYAVCEYQLDRTSFAILLPLLATAIAGIIVAGDLFNLFVFLELAAISSTGLISLKRRGAGAVFGFVYLVYASLSGLLFLVGVVVLYAGTGVLTLAEIAAASSELDATTIVIAFVCFLVSFGIKFGLVPLHFWQAPVYDAAGSTAAAFLSGTAMKAYLYAVIRITWHVLRIPTAAPQAFVALLIFGMINIVIGHLAGLAERDVKRLLAYSGVAHVGYILVGLAVAGATAEYAGAAGAALAAALLHVLMHTLTKTTLFFSARRLIAHARTSAIDGLGGAARAEPVAFSAFFVAALAIVGIPPTIGFASKWYISLAALERFGIVPVIVISLGTVISMVYYTRIAVLALGPDTRFGADDRRCSGVVPSAHPIGRAFGSATMVLLAAATVALGPASSVLRSFLMRAAPALTNFEAYLALVRGPL
ncbi:MAG: hypothetical protein EA426_17675 [Spirochaetaceae bacterium]|nr:MAG: hypothetical protein EA426_17675 [Spirochaetaceae bacterium]